MWVWVRVRMWVRGGEDMCEGVGEGEGVYVRVRMGVRVGYMQEIFLSGGTLV